MSSSVEILGQWITLPDPDSVASLSNHYYRVSTTLADTKSQLSAIGSPQAAARWTGLAADAFAGRLGALPGELEQAWQSYNAVARALSGYSTNLRPVVAALRSLAYQAEEAQGTLNATQAARDQAARTGQESATGVWNTRLAEAKAAVSVLARRRSSLLTELDQLSAECVRQIHQAAPETVHQDLLSDLKRYALDAGHLIVRAEYDTGRFEFMVAKDLFYQPFDSLYDDFKKGDWNPTNWDAARWGKVLEDISGVLGVLAIVCAPVPGLDAVLALGAIGFGVAATGAEIIGASKGEKGASWADVAFDAGGAVLMGSGHVVGEGLKLADGPEAKVSAKSLWQSGNGHFFNLSDPDPDTKVILQKPLTVHDPIPVYKGAVDSYLHAGVDGDSAASQKVAEHVEWGIDRAGNAVGVGQTEYDKKSGGS